MINNTALGTSANSPNHQAATGPSSNPGFAKKKKDWKTEKNVYPGQLQNHKKLEHGGIIKCPHCHKTFSWAQHRDAHVKNKHTETVNKCACGASYVKKWQLERHEEECIVSPVGVANAVGVDHLWVDLFGGDSQRFCQLHRKRSARTADVG